MTVAFVSLPERPAAGARARGLLRRLLHSVVVLWGAATLTFAMLHLTGGDPVDDIVGGNSQVTEPVRRQIAAEYGLDRPILTQYVDYLGRILRGDLGRSYQLRMPVAEAIGRRIGPTAQLMGAAALLAAVFAVLVAVVTAGRRPWLRWTAMSAEVAMIAVPTFWLGILLMEVFSFRLNWFPVTGGASGVVLPAITMATPLAAVLTQVLREGMEQALDEPFVVTARARGLGEAAVRLRHALRHALLPVLTLLGLAVASMAGGAVIVEQVFLRPGIGQLMLNAVDGKDIPVVSGVVLVAASCYVVINTLIDLLYPVVDPRLRDR